jgi:DNA-directed RNA polymerase I, II, and III subunit RPABC2
MEDEEDDDDVAGPYLQKFNAEVNKNYLIDFHPECTINNYDEINTLTRVIRDKNNNVVDEIHKTIPFLTKYERTRIIGQRAKQINSGAKAFVKVPENVIDGYLVAELELSLKRIPFIIRRPLPGGGCEYWNLKDLEVVSF